MAENETVSNTPRARRSPAQFWILVALFLGPLLAAFLLYYGMGGWRPAGSTNHGDLIQPPVPLPELELIAPTKLGSTVFRDKWSIVYIGNGRCDARCREALTLMRQTRLALNDDLTRVRRVFLVTRDCCDQAYLEAQHAGLTTALLDAPGGEHLKEVFQSVTPEPLDEAGRIYIVDPLGNLMMSYSSSAEPKGLLEDLEKLLKLSHIG